MAKRRKSSRKSSKCPEPFNTLIDIAAGLTMHAIADKMEKKHNYHKRGVPNPYRASAYGLTMGKLNKTEDIIKLGGFMGAMGAFDDDYVPPEQRLYHPDTSWEFDDVGDNYSQSNDNRYAWRLNCEDGSEYGIDPEDYETRDEYNEALSDAKLIYEDEEFDADESMEVFSPYQEPQQAAEKFILCRVSILKSGENRYFLCDIEGVVIGNMVVIPVNDNEEKGVVLSVEHHTRITAPCNPDELQHIIRVEK